MRPTARTARGATAIVALALALTACTTDAPTTSAPTRTSPTAHPQASTSPTSHSTPANPSNPPSATPQLRPGWTAVTVILLDDAVCPGGRVGAHSTLRSPVWETFAKIPESGEVTLAVPTKSTRGMAFDVQCRTWPSTGAVPIVVLQYAEAAPGDSPAVDGSGRPVSEAGSYCWAGTKDTAYSLDVRAWIDAGDGSPLSGKVALYADPTVASIGYSSGERWQEAPDGQMGHQDEPYC